MECTIPCVAADLDAHMFMYHSQSDTWRLDSTGYVADERGHPPKEVPGDARRACIHQDKHGNVLCELGADATHRDHGEPTVHEEHLHAV